jgi:hypothetical protein
VTNPDKASLTFGCILPDHLAELEPRQWALWRWVGLRGARFPLTGVLSLAVRECAVAADELIEAEASAERAWLAALEELKGEIAERAPDRRQLLLKALKRLKKCRIPEQMPAEARSSRAVQSFADQLKRVEQAQERYQQIHNAAIRKSTDEARLIAGSPKFREAVIWQNHAAFRTGVDPIARQERSSGRDSQQRKHEELIANYWQRYCAKNDTIGYFGPVGWARLSDATKTIDVRPGTRLVARRCDYFEGWCIDALADLLSSDREIRRWIAPRPAPFLNLEDSVVTAPQRQAITLSPGQRSVLRACDGKRTAAEIAGALLDDPAAGFESQSAVFDALDYLDRNGLIRWRITIPSRLDPEIGLRELLARIGNHPARDRALGLLEELEDARRGVSNAAGNADELDRAFDQLESTFTRLTGVAPTRAEGRTYGSRTLVYQDCRRDIDVKIGNEVLHSLAAPLALLLKSARWLNYSAATRCRQVFAGIYDDIVAEKGCPVVSGPDFWARAQSELLGRKGDFGDELLEQFQEKWAGILAISEDQCAVHRSSSELKPLVEQAFPAPHPGWQYARYHSPDVMIAASSAEAIRRGDYQFVLGELHTATNTLSTSLFLSQHPSVDELFAAIAYDLPGCRVVPSPPKYAHSAREATALVSSKDYYLELTLDSPSPSPRQALPLASLVIEPRNGDLTARTRDGRLHFGIVEIFGSLLTWQVVNSFKLLKPAPHRPRVSLDKLVVARESWQLAASEIELAFEKN